jgi:hypothetical protein
MAASVQRKGMNESGGEQRGGGELRKNMLFSAFLSHSASSAYLVFFLSRVG